MQGGSSFGVQSSSYHSSSYLPKLEASFMKDFSCCDMILASLHDLLQHFEEAHAQQISAPIGTPFLPTTGGGLASGLPASRGPQQPIRQHQQQQITSSTTTQPSSSQQPTNTLQNARQNSAFKAGDYRATQLQPIQDMDAVEDMEMDDVDDMNGATFEPDFPLSSPSQQYMPQDQAQARSRFGQPASARLPPLDLNGMTMGGNPMQPNFQGLRQSQPSTPIAGRPGGIYHNNPTVSSVNTPTLNAFPLQQQQQQFRHTPESSAPGTPAELDPEFMGGMNNMSMDQTQSFLQGQQDMSGFAFANGNELIDLCIDEPAKRLFSPNGGFTTQQGAQSRLGTAQYGPDSDIARRIREQQRKAGLADTVSGVEGGEQKPFRCPVIGCEKAYKNQNGLKYHKAVSTSSPRQSQLPILNPIPTLSLSLPGETAS
jgi:transcription factor SFP1